MASRPPHEALHRQDTGQTITPRSRRSKSNPPHPMTTQKGRKYGLVIHREPFRNRALPGTIKEKERPGIPGRTPAGKAQGLDARQAEVIRKAPLWLRHHPRRS